VLHLILVQWISPLIKTSAVGRETAGEVALKMTVERTSFSFFEARMPAVETFNLSSYSVSALSPVLEEREIQEQENHSSYEEVEFIPMKLPAGEQSKEGESYDDSLDFEVESIQDSPYSEEIMPVSGILDITDKVEMAQVINLKSPRYPKVSRRLRQEGRVILYFEINLKGQAHSVEVHESSGYSRLDQAAIDALRHSRFQSGVASGSIYSFVFDFKLHRVGDGPK
jgi:TonB family protein